MTDNVNWALRHSVGLAIVLLVAASVALTLGFACALPLASFAAISGLMFERRAAIGAILSVWAVNQAVGFSCLHYPVEPTTIAWGFGLAALGLASLFTARAVLARVNGPLAAPAAFLAAFAAYEGLLFLINLAVGLHAAVFAPAVVARIFAINVAAFAIFALCRTLWSRTAFGRDFEASLMLRHA